MVLIFPSFLQTAMMHEKSWICLNPAFLIKAQTSAGDDPMDVRMPFQVGTKSAVTFINMTAQDRAATGQHLTHIFKYDWSDPSFVLGNELNPMDSEDSRNVITDMG